MQVSKRIEFECAYIAKYQLEAHRYQLSVAVEHSQPKQDADYIISFEVLADIMRLSVYDKMFLINNTDITVPIDLLTVMERCGVPTVEFDTPLCAEAICTQCVKNIQDRLDHLAPGVKVVSAKLIENSSSYVVWSRNSDSVVGSL